MWDLTEDNALDYLAGRQGMSVPGGHVEALGGGVSSTVLLVTFGNRRFVLKQALGKLKVEQDWFSDRSRLLRECRSMRDLAELFPAGTLPRIEFIDETNYVFAMEAAPSGSLPWKTLLLRGEGFDGIAEQVGAMLGAMFRGTWGKADWRDRYGDQSFFDELRLDPYYRSTAARHPDLAPQFRELLEETDRRRVCLVHGDWSPKNLLVANGRVIAIDFEVVHFGDPSFDTAFLLNHLALKAIHKPQWTSRYRRCAAGFFGAALQHLPPDAGWMEGATIRHLGGLMLARVDGKSPVEYLSAEERTRVRQLARELILQPPESVDAVFEKIGE